MEPLLIFSIVGVVISMTLLICGIRGYFRGRKLYNDFIEAMNNYLKEEAIND